MAKNKDTLSDKQNRLIDLLKHYPRPNHSDDDACGLTICILLAADENGWTDEFIRICEDNPNVTFDEILDLIFDEERFPPLDIIDDDEEE